jgi:hypothetical protein
MVCFRLSKKNFLKLTFSLLTAFIILLGGIDHANADTYSNFSSNLVTVSPSDFSTSTPNQIIGASNNLFQTNAYRASGVNILNYYFSTSTLPSNAIIDSIQYSVKMKASTSTQSIRFQFSPSTFGGCSGYTQLTDYFNVATTSQYYYASYDNAILKIPTNYDDPFLSCWLTPDILQNGGRNADIFQIKQQPMQAGAMSFDSITKIIFYHIPDDIIGCTDNMAINYDATANVNSGECYYTLPETTASSTTRIINYTFSTTTNKVNISYNINSSDGSILLYTENKNERDGVINSAYSSTTAGLTELTNIAITLPDPLNGAGYTYLTAKLVLASNLGVVFDWAVITADLYSNTAVSTGGISYQPAECGITNLGGCFVNGLAVIFYPSQSAFNNFNSFVEVIKTKPPVGYFYIVKNNLTALNSTSTGAFNITIPTHIKTYLFTPFDVGIGAILWFFFAINFYKRLKHITV